MGIVTILFVINYILALYFIFILSNDNNWDKIVDAMEEPIMEEENANKMVRHSVAIIYLIPGFAIVSFLKMLIRKI